MHATCSLIVAPFPRTRTENTERVKKTDRPKWTELFRVSWAMCPQKNGSPLRSILKKKKKEKKKRALDSLPRIPLHISREILFLLNSVCEFVVRNGRNFLSLGNLFSTPLSKSKHYVFYIYVSSVLSCFFFLTSFRTQSQPFEDECRQSWVKLN